MTESSAPHGAGTSRGHREEKGGGHEGARGGIEGSELDEPSAAGEVGMKPM